MTRGSQKKETKRKHRAKLAENEWIRGEQIERKMSGKYIAEKSKSFGIKNGKEWKRRRKDSWKIEQRKWTGKHKVKKYA